jgi:hypothetical protein
MEFEKLDGNPYYSIVIHHNEERLRHKKKLVDKIHGI